MKTSIFKNIPATIAVFVAFIAGISNVYRFQYFGSAFSWAADSSNPAAWATYVFIAQIVLTPILAIATVVLALVRFNKILNLLLIGASFFVVIVLGIISDLGWSMATGQHYSLVDSFFNWSSAEYSVFSVFNIFIIIASALAVVSLFVKIPAPAAPATVGFDPVTGAPLATVAAPVATEIATDGKQVSQLPLVAFILAFISPLIGLIIGYVALNQMKVGTISTVNQKQAKNAVLVGWIMFAVGFAASIIITVVFILAAASTYNSYY